jgi:hypothetical protein
VKFLFVQQDHIPVLVQEGYVRFRQDVGTGDIQQMQQIPHLFQEDVVKHGNQSNTSNKKKKYG